MELDGWSQFKAGLRGRVTEGRKGVWKRTNESGRQGKESGLNGVSCDEH